MTSKTFNFLINTENYDTLNSLVKQLESQVKSNEAVLGRIANIADHTLRYPDLVVSEQPQAADKSGKPGNGDTENIEIVTADGDGDELRHYLDSKYKLDQMKREDQQFAEVENPKLRQLLSDHAKLQQILNAKKRVNGQLLQIYMKYDQLLREVILPKLGQDISRANIERIQHIGKHDVETKLGAEQRLWNKYHQYVGVLEKVKMVNHALLRILDGYLDQADIQRLEAQLRILHELVGHMRNGKLERKREPVLFRFGG